MKSENCTFDEIKFYIQLVIVQLVHFQARVKCSNMRKNIVYDTFVTQCGVGHSQSHQGRNRAYFSYIQEPKPREPEVAGPAWY